MSMIDYKEYRLGSLCKRFSSGKGISADWINEIGKYPVIGGNGLRGYTDNYNFDGECAVIGRQGAYCGNVQFFSGKGYMTEHAVVTQPNSANNAKYLTYKLSGLSLGRFSGQSAQPGLSVTKLARLRIEMPPKWYQDKVAGILSAYDNLIEVNSKRIKVLEQIAENLYKEWFVRFRFPGHEKAEFENGIPKGWAICKISDIATIKAGGDRPEVFSDTPTEECPIPVFSNGLDIDGLYGYTDKAVIENESVTISARGTVGFVCLRRKPYVPIVRLLAVIPKAQSVTPLYLYYYLKRDSVIANGTSQQQITVPMVSRKRMIIPPESILQAFDNREYPIWNLVDVLKTQNAKLIQQRDLLLPRLMSGKLEV